MDKAPITLTANAIARIKHLISKTDKQVFGIRIGVDQKGCSGFGYDIGYAEEENPKDAVVEAEGVKVFIDNAALLYLIGSELDYVEEELFAGFKFNNPNAKGECGCGESFTV